MLDADPFADLDGPHLDTVDVARGLDLAGYYLAEAKRLKAKAQDAAEIADVKALLRVAHDRHGGEGEVFTITDIANFGPGHLRGVEGQAAREVAWNVLTATRHIVSREVEGRRNVWGLHPESERP